MKRLRLQRNATESQGPIWKLLKGMAAHKCSRTRKIKHTYFILHSKKTSSYLLVHSATAFPAPQKSASSSIPSSKHTVLSTSKHTASALRQISRISAYKHTRCLNNSIYRYYISIVAKSSIHILFSLQNQHCHICSQTPLVTRMPHFRITFPRETHLLSWIWWLLNLW